VSNDDIPTPDQMVQLAAFRVGDEDYVVDIMRIKEIINPLKITPVHDTTGLIKGVINLRGVIIPVVDLRKRLRLPAVENTRRTKYLIAAVESRVVGFIVDEVLEVVRTLRSTIRLAPQLDNDQEAGLLVGVFQKGERLLLLLNLKKVLTASFLSASLDDVIGEV
jgi:purine-binding chemotaxis protein CheW